MQTIEAVPSDYEGVLTRPVKHSIACWLAANAIDPKSFSRTLHAWLSQDTEESMPIHRLKTSELTVADFEGLHYLYPHGETVRSFDRIGEAIHLPRDADLDELKGKRMTDIESDTRSGGLPRHFCDFPDMHVLVGLEEGEAW